MKKWIMMIVLGLTVLFFFSMETNAQNRKSRSSQENARSQGENRKIVTRPGRVTRNKVVYRKPRNKVTSVRRLPKTTVVYRHQGLDYNYANGRYYRYYGGNYITVVPHIGLRITTLPVGYISIFIGPRTYFYFEGIYYSPVYDEYEVVIPEIGMIVNELPSGYEKVKIDEQTYYEYDNVLYRKINTHNGRAYEVVGIID